VEWELVNYTGWKSKDTPYSVQYLDYSIDMMNGLRSVQHLDSAIFYLHPKAKQMF
jgi:hypothetical protein